MNKATSTHGHSIKQSDHDSSNADQSDCVANDHSTRQQQYLPYPLAYPDAPNLLVEPHPWKGREWHWPYEFEGLTS